MKFTQVTTSLILFALIFAKITSVFAADETQKNSSIELAHQHAEPQRVRAVQQHFRLLLSQGHIEEARSILETAMGNFHAVEMELAMVQTLMQAGEYRHAMSAAAHTQAEHPSDADTTILYAWLMAVGAQPASALQLLENTRKEQPHLESILKLQEQIKTQKLAAADLKVSDAIQLGPLADPALDRKYSKPVSTGVIFDEGRKIIMSTSFATKTNFLVRSGMGAIRTAKLFKNYADLNLTILELEKPIAHGVNTGVAGKTPFPGAMIYVLGFPQSTAVKTAWPQMRMDVLGTPLGELQQGYPIHLQNLAAGSGVFDQQGNLVGIVGGANNRVMLPVSDVIKTSANISLQESANKVLIDEVYEGSLASVVEIFGEQ